MNEMATLQHLSKPGHANVVGIVECMQDSENLYAVLPFIAKVRPSTHRLRPGNMKHMVTCTWANELWMQGNLTLQTIVQS